jgi:hypothetical protein
LSSGGERKRAGHQQTLHGTNPLRYPRPRSAAHQIQKSGIRIRSSSSPLEFDSRGRWRDDAETMAQRWQGLPRQQRLGE